MDRQMKTETEINNNINKLLDHFGQYLQAFENANKFTGPSLYFHLKTLDRLKEIDHPSVAVRDLMFLEYLYATLAAWGMHRMGPKGAKLVYFSEFSKSLGLYAKELDDLSGLRIDKLEQKELPSIGNNLWSLIDRMEISATESRIVSGSKVLHHLLPNLIPPIDRQHTAKFFLWQNRMQYWQKEMFYDIFPRFVYIAEEIQKEAKDYIGKGFNTGLPKIVDNAIIGFIIQEKPTKVIDED